MKNLLIFSFAVICMGFFFYVVATQVIQPMANPGADVPQLVDFPKLVQGFFEQILHSINKK
jgi:hypothetical protein